MLPGVGKTEADDDFPDGFPIAPVGKGQKAIPATAPAPSPAFVSPCTLDGIRPPPPTTTRSLSIRARYAAYSSDAWTPDDLHHPHYLHQEDTGWGHTRHTTSMRSGWMKKWKALRPTSNVKATIRRSHHDRETPFSPPGSLCVLLLPSRTKRLGGNDAAFQIVCSAFRIDQEGCAWHMVEDDANGEAGKKR